jgi:adenylate cyclase
VVLLGLVALVAVGTGITCYLTDAFRSLELNTVDTRFSIRGERAPPEDIVIVGIDAQTFQAFERIPAFEGKGRWPFAHDIHADVIDRLRRDGAKVIALDIQFSERSDTEDETFAMLEAIHRARNVVASTTEVDRRGNGNAFTYYVAPRRIRESKEPGALTRWHERELRVNIASGNLPTDPGGTLRRVPYDDNGLESFAIATAEEATGRRVDPDSLGGEYGAIDFYGPPRTFEHISYSDVRLGETKPGEFKDKIVVVGATSPVLQDVHPSPTPCDGNMAGPEIQANAIATALAGFPLQEAPAGLEIALILVLGLVVPAASLRFSTLRSMVAALLLAGLLAIAVQLAFNAGWIVDLVYPLLALVVSAVGALAVYYLTEAIERERTRDMFSRFVPESVVGQVLEQTDGLRLGGVGRNATVFFSDIRGFTSFAETIQPDQVITILNRYLTAMVDDAILPNRGTLVDYMGDGIMAVFGAPIEMDDHADCALAAARASLVELEKFNDWLRDEMGFEQSFHIGIGLNSGRVMSGNVGSERRLAYTAIGDTTNTAARLEAMTKESPYMLYMSESTRAQLSSNPDDLVEVDEFEVRGREQKVKVWSVEEAAKGEAGQVYRSVSKS